jgi:hypothetical protein
LSSGGWWRLKGYPSLEILKKRSPTPLKIWPAWAAKFLGRIFENILEKMKNLRKKDKILRQILETPVIITNQ